MTDYKSIYRHLTSGGYDVYSMGQHRGECKTPYLVLKNRGSDLVYSVADRLYEILMYYPADRYSEFEDYIAGVKHHMAGLFPHVKMASDESEHYLDDDKKAYMSFILYRAPKIARYIYETD